MGDLPRGAYTPYTAAQRAAAAAQRVPSPEPAPRRAKAKSVRWVEEDRVAAVRWFLAADPPAAVQQDADPDAARAALVAAAAEGTQAAAIAPGPGPSAALTSAPADAAPRFESAARLEHLSEASVLRAHRLQEDAELEEMAERLAGMLPVMAWRPPPGVAAAAAAAAAGQGIAAGEESAEAGEALARREQSRTARAHYPRGLLDCPACAEEPGDGWSRGEWEARHPPLRIPLSVEEAAAAAAATRQAPPQQQQPPQLAPFGGARDPPISQRDTFQNRPPPQQQHYQGGGTPAGHRTPHGQPPPPPAPPPPLNLNFGALDQLLRGMRSGPALDSGPPAPGGAIRHAPEGPAPMGFQGQGYGHGPPNMQAHPPAENSRGFAPAGAWPQGLVQPTPGPPPPRPPSEPLSGRQAHRQGGHGLKPLPHVRCKFFFGPKVGGSIGVQARSLLGAPGARQALGAGGLAGMQALPAADPLQFLLSTLPTSTGLPPGSRLPLLARPIALSYTANMMARPARPAAWPPISSAHPLARLVPAFSMPCPTGRPQVLEPRPLQIRPGVSAVSCLACMADFLWECATPAFPQRPSFSQMLLAPCCHCPTACIQELMSAHHDTIGFARKGWGSLGNPMGPPWKLQGSQS